MSTGLRTAATIAVPDPRAQPCPYGGRAAIWPPARGRGRLAVEVVDGLSAAVACAAASPLHIFTPRARGPAVSAMIATYGGGLLAGDSIDLAVEIAPGASALLATQAETKVYRSEGPWATQRLAAQVAAGGVLAVLPEPTSPFAGARYRQDQRFELARGASLLLVDAVTSGRSARGERWAFDAHLSRSTVAVDGRPVLHDAVRLVDGEGASVAERMRGFELLATLVAVGPAVASGAEDLLRELGRGVPPRPGADVLAAASPLAGGVYLRLAARAVEPGVAFLRNRAARALPALVGPALERLVS